jgi:hypothetical protein
VISNVYVGIVKIDGHNGSYKETNVGQFSHLVITNLKIGLIVFTQVRTRLLRMDFPNFFENWIDFMREPKPNPQVSSKILLV